MSAGSRLVVSLRPGIAALSGVVAVLHARKAEIEEVTYSVSRGTACMLISLRADAEQAKRLAAQVNRRVDVLTVDVGMSGAA